MRDFDARTAAGAEITAFLETEYIAVHPFADDDLLLQRLSWPAEQCFAVDAYWRVLGDVVFVQVSSSARGGWNKPIGRYVRRDSRSQYVDLVAIVATNTITQAVFENELSAFLEQGVLVRALKQGAKLGPNLVPAATIVGGKDNRTGKGR